jgi:excinuclease ABC subunit B
MYADKRDRGDGRGAGRDGPPRAIQLAYNERHGITPESIVKGISDITEFLVAESKVPKKQRGRARKRAQAAEGEVTVAELEQTIVEIEEEMAAAAEELRFEYAARLRDELRDLRRELGDLQRATA